MAKSRSKLSRAIIAVVVLAIVAGGAYFAFFNGPGDKQVTAQFESAVGVYPGTPVKILGVNVGTVSSVKPNGDYVAVTMTYDPAYKLPSNAAALLVANSLVSDRFVQLAPAYKNGPVLNSGGTIPLKRTAAPAELDDIYSALNKLSVALGPKGANKKGAKGGALATLVDVGAANLKGNGAALGNSITKLSQAAQTLAGGRKDLFATVHNLQNFTKALTQSDSQVRLFNQQLAQVAGDLASERADLGTALHDLGLALDEVSSFVKKNASRLHRSITGLESITGTLVKEKSSFNETVTLAPVALANIVHAYQPNIGVIATRSNLASLTDFSPAEVCAVLYSTIHAPGAVANVLGSLTGTINTVCTSALSKLGGGDPTKAIQKILGGLSPGQVGGQVGGLLGGGIGGIIGTGVGG